MIVPPTIGNADPEWPLPRNPAGPGAGLGNGVAGPGGAGPPAAFIIQPIDAFPNTLPRKCVWAMLLLSCLLVLRVQQDRYAEILRWRGGVPDMGRFPWEDHGLASGSDAFEATFLSPVMRKASTFLRAPQEASMVITGLTKAVLSRPIAGEGSASVAASAGSSSSSSMLPGFVTAVTESSLLPSRACLSNTTSCFVGTQRARSVAASHGLLPGSSACHRVVVGGSIRTMRPLVGANGSVRLLCIRSEFIEAVVPTAVNGTFILSWEPQPASGEKLLSSISCLAAVALPDMRVKQVVAVERVSTVLYDRGSASLVTISYTLKDSQLIAMALDPVTLLTRWKYRLPLSVAWLLRAPRVSDGFLLFVGSEDPFLGSIFTIDLVNSQVYEQDAPSSGTRRPPQRRRLPREMVAECYPNQVPGCTQHARGSVNKGPAHHGLIGRPCETVSVGDVGS